MRRGHRGPRKARAHCCACGEKSADANCSWMRTACDFVFLYLVGAYELLRQLLFSPFIPEVRISSQKRWKDSETSNLVLLITGSTSGIGEQLCRLLQDSDARVVLLTHQVPDKEKAKNEQLVADLSSRESTERAAAEIRERLLQEDVRTRQVVLLHCAGIYHPPRDGDGFVSIWKTLMVNTLMPALLLNRMSDLLSGVVFLGSSAQKAAPNISGSRCPLQVARSPYAAYPLSKMLGLVYAEQWSTRHNKPVMVVHPGVVSTNLYRREGGVVGSLLRFVLSLFAWNPETSARRVLDVIVKAKFLASVGDQEINGSDVPVSGVYWDAVSGERASIPNQAGCVAHRGWVARHIEEAFQV